MTTAGDVLVAGPQTGPAPEAQIVADLLRRALPVLPVPVLVGALAAGSHGAASAAVAIGLVLANLVAAAASLTWAARINLGALMGVAMFGYLVRISALFGAVYVLRELAWVHLGVLGWTLVVSHLGLLAWELRYVSASLAYPALEPAASRTPRPHLSEKESVQ